MKENAKLPVTVYTNESHPAHEDFKGYSMEELRYQRAMVALKKEFCKNKVTSGLNSLRHPGGKNTGTGAMSNVRKVANIAGKLFSNMNVIDCALVGMSLFGSGRKIYKLFGRKK